MSPVATQPKIVLAGIGTKGDLLPLLALGRELVQRGHPCHLLGNEGTAALAASHELGFTPVTVEQTDNTVSNQHTVLLVHHGGIGTTARAFQAGVPQIIRARMYDQPDNGDRVQRLGVGRCLHGEGDTTEALITAAKHLTSSGEVQRQLEHFRSAIAASGDGIPRAASSLEHFLAKEWPSALRLAS
jgi:UDP:flavonoid glycosyltransferase YjiC (YdhE family)